MLTLRRLHIRDSPLIVMLLGNEVILRSAISGLRVVAGDWWGRVKIGRDCEVMIVPAYHWSARTGRDRRFALWSGFVLNSSAGRVYFSGDTAYGNGRIFQEIRQRSGRPDLALIPIGAYAPRWFMCAQHTDPNEAVQILENLEAARAVGIHWGVFRLTDEHREEPPALLLKALARHGIAADLFPAGMPGAQLRTPLNPPTPAAMIEILVCRFEARGFGGRHAPMRRPRQLKEVIQKAHINVGSIATLGALVGGEARR